MKFLERVATTLYQKHGDRISDIEIVLPTENAVNYFKQYLMKLMDDGAWLPIIEPMDHWLTHYTTLTPADDITLIFNLFDSYKRIATRAVKQFDTFYSWGKMILEDFNEIDRELVNAQELFKNLSGISDIELKFAEEDSPDMYRRYVTLRGLIGTLYRDFRTVLKNRGEGYLGMLYREVAEERALKIRGEEICFIGFDRLCRGEQLLFKNLKDRHIAQFFWDCDTYYTEEWKQEGGYFFRRNRVHLEMEALEGSMAQLGQPKKISIIGVPSKISEAKTAGVMIARQLAEHGAASLNGETGVVLADPGQLYPMLGALPNSITAIHPGLKFPLKESHIYRLIHNIIVLYENQRLLNRPDYFHHEDLIRVLSHNYIRLLINHHHPQEDLIKGILTKIRDHNWVFVHQHTLIREGDPIGIPIFSTIFTTFHSATQLIDTLFELLNMIESVLIIEQQTSGKWGMDLEQLSQFKGFLRRIQWSIDRYNMQLDISVFWQFFNEVLGHLEIEFSDQPGEGLHLMDLEESRLIDFKHLMILSVNEGVFPEGKGGGSFIPPEVRRAFKMPTYREHDALFAYRFYRLLQYAQEITLIYNVSLDEYGKGEKSRFIEQLISEYAITFPDTEITHETAVFHAGKQRFRPINIMKTDEMVAKMQQQPLSATTLNTFLNCPLKYYFRYMLNLLEESEVKSSADPATFGLVVHKILEDFYRDQDLITKHFIQNNRRRLGEMIPRYYRNEAKIQFIDTGKNKLNLSLIQKLLEHFCDVEAQRPPFKVVDVERRFRGLPFAVNTPSGEQAVFQLKGYIDRIDQIGESIHVIDYKTGKAPQRLTLKGAWQEEPEKLSREAVQLLFYGYLIARSEKPIDPIYMGIYQLFKLSKGVQYLREKGEPTTILEQYDRFESFLSKQLLRMVDQNEPFYQTDDQKRCEYCLYREICQRY